jgi:hypothetical protein
MVSFIGLVLLVEIDIDGKEDEGNIRELRKLTIG